MSKLKRKKPISPLQILIYILLSILVLIYLLPLIWMLSVSLKTNKEVFASPFGFPEVLQIGNYIFAWVYGNLGGATLNSFIRSEEHTSELQ